MNSGRVLKQEGFYGVGRRKGIDVWRTVTNHCDGHEAGYEDQDVDNREQDE